MVYLCFYYITTVRLFSNPLFPYSVWSAVQLISWDLFTSLMCFIVIFSSESKLELLIPPKECQNSSYHDNTCFYPNSCWKGELFLHKDKPCIVHVYSGVTQRVMECYFHGFHNKWGKWTTYPCLEADLLCKTEPRSYISKSWSAELTSQFKHTNSQTGVSTAQIYFGIPPSLQAGLQASSKKTHKWETGFSASFTKAT